MNIEHLSNLYGVFHREFELNWSYQEIGYECCMLFCHGYGGIC